MYSAPAQRTVPANGSNSKLDPRSPRSEGAEANTVHEGRRWEDWTDGLALNQTPSRERSRLLACGSGYLWLMRTVSKIGGVDAMCLAA